jgi:hypothetical protein
VSDHAAKAAHRIRELSTMTFLDLHRTYHVARAILELLYFLSSVGLLIVAYWALDQLTIAKTDIATRVRREAAKETALQLNHWATEIIPTMDNMWRARRATNFPHFPCSMERFDLEEMAEKLPLAVNHNNAVDAFKDPIHAEARTLIVKSANMVEASAMYFMTGVADEQIAFMSLSPTFCDFVEGTAFYYCGTRNKDQLNRWEYTIGLYRKWSQRRAKHDLGARHRTLSEELDKASNDAAPVPPIGA